MKFIAAGVLMATLTMAANCQAQQATPTQQPAQIYVIQRRPCLLRIFARARYNRMFVPPAVAVPVQPAQPMRWVPGRWEPIR